MPVVLRDKLVSDYIDIECEVDGIPFNYITQLDYRHVVNSARLVKIGVGGIEPISMVALGSIISLKAGRGETTHNLDFLGVVVQVSPSYTQSEITVVDYITYLQTSELVDYKQQDLIGEDLYYLASVACNYKDIDVSELTEGSGIKATADMDLAGLQTRRQFIDKCFRYLMKVAEDTSHPTVAAVPWRYGIRRNKIMDFWLEDPTNLKSKPVLTVSDISENLTGPGIVAKIDTTQMVNSATFQSSANPDVYATITDNDSVARHGIHAKLYKLNTTRHDRLQELAYTTVLRHKEPTTTYRIVMTHGEYITLGDYIRIKVTSFNKDVLLPVVDMSHTITDKVESIITVGTPELSISQYIAAIT